MPNAACFVCSRWYILSLTPFGICGAYTVLPECNISSVVRTCLSLVRRWLCDCAAAFVWGCGWPNADVGASSRQWPLVSMKGVSGFTLGFLESFGKSCWRDFSLSASCFVDF